MTVRILTGDAKEQLRTLPDASVHCVVTSPPYWGLRDYGTATWEGGAPDCDHRGPPMRTNNKPSSSNATFHGGSGRANEPMGTVCSKCGANRIDSQLGLEPTPEEYVANMVEVFREVRRVLRDDGTCWVNLGDSYAANVNGRSAADTKALGRDDRTFRDKPFSTVGGVIKPKDLCGIPWRVAFALQADGWWLRQDIIWSKPNPMPESVRDRCTKAHEYLFLLTKSARYYFDQEAIAESVADSSIERQSQETLDSQVGSDRVPGKTNGNMKAVGRLSPHMEGTPRNDGDRWRLADGGVAPRGFRNKRSVWTITTKPFPEAHFATFPPALVEPCIKAGCPEGGTVLDPFGGSGTTGLVADRLGRSAILIELNPEYAAMAERRIKGDAGLFAEIDAA